MVGSLAKDRQMELDVVAGSQDGNYLLVGECKWSDKDINTEELWTSLKEKAGLLPFAEGKTIVPVLF
jgi:hypothetical protein